VSQPWLFSRSTDLWVFGAPALVSLLLVAAGLAHGDALGDLPAGLWLLTVLAVDVSHVWSTIFRTYADGDEVRRRPLLYLGTPLLAYAAGVALHLAGGAALFWRVLAYGAVFHFVRQQYGWVRLYRRRGGERDRLGSWLDGATIYAATLVPLLIWHARLPRKFHWFVEGDFASGLSPRVVPVACALYAALLSAYLGRALLTRSTAWGKHLLVGSTALCWWLGIVSFDSDFIFSVTNVLIHGVPYFALIWRYGRGRWAGQPGTVAGIFRLGWGAFYALLVAVAFLEEGAWDGLVWHEHAQFFGDTGLELGPLALALLVPLLAVPQAVHYLLDGFIWRVGPDNPGLAERLDLR